MAKTRFSEGERPTLEEVLHTREMRANYQYKLASAHGGHGILSFKLNIPGPVKNNKHIEGIFTIGVEAIKSVLEHTVQTVIFEKEIHLSTGPELFLVIRGPVEELKKAAIRIEEENPLGRMFDIDILLFQEGTIRTLLREEFGYPERRCLLCGNSSKACGRNRTHPVEELLDKMEEMAAAYSPFKEDRK